LGSGCAGRCSCREVDDRDVGIGFAAVVERTILA